MRLSTNASEMTEQQDLPSAGTDVDLFSQGSEKWGEWLACPQCGAALRDCGEKLYCIECQQGWPIIDGIPHFVQDFPYWGEIPLEQMREVNRVAQRDSWKSALLDSPEPSVQEASQMILNLDRANWHLLLNLPPESRVLDLGAGTGTNAHALAMHYREVIAVEPVLERVQFMQQRFAQEQLSNIRILRTSLWDLPIAKASLDLVAMNGVLEWVAEGRAGDPGELQERALRNVGGLLRPGGYLYLGIENRMSPAYFVGYPDPHCRLPFVTILPRRLAQWYARRKGAAGGYRNYLYSSRGYRKLLQKVGFERLEFYVAVPSYNHPRFLIPLESDVFSYFARSSSGGRIGGLRRRLRRLAHDLLLSCKLLKYCEYSFVIIARKESQEA